jgi:hypothetical protein
MSSQKLKITKTELIEKQENVTKRYPNLSTVLMVEDFLRTNRDQPMKISDIKKQLQKQLMHQTLLIILEYLWRSGKIIYGPKGVQWIYTSPEHLKKMLQDSIEV